MLVVLNPDEILSRATLREILELYRQVCERDEIKRPKAFSIMSKETGCRLPEFESCPSLTSGAIILIGSSC